MKKLKTIPLWETFEKEYLNIPLHEQDDDDNQTKNELLAGNKIRLAMIGIIRYLPFFGDIMNKLGIYQNNSIDTMATDGLRIYYNSEWTAALTVPQVRFVICHEILHNTLDHLKREGSRDHDRFNKAADYALNPLLMDIDMSHNSEALLDIPRLPSGEPNGLLDKKYYGMTAEQIYDLLPSEDDKPPKPPKPPKPGKPGKPGKDGDGGGGGGGGGGKPGKPGKPGKGGKGGEPGDDEPGDGDGDGDGEPGDGDGDGDGDGKGGGDGDGKGGGGDGDWGEMIRNSDVDHSESKDINGNPVDSDDPRSKEEIARDVNKIVKDAAIKTSGNNPQSIERIIKSILEVKIPWQAILRKYINSICNKTEARWKDTRLATLGINVQDERKIYGLNNVVVAIDTSGSVRSDELAIYMKEIANILKPHPIKNLYILQCDSEVKKAEIVHIRNPRKIPTTFKLVGGGGTNFQKVFDWVRDNIRGAPDLMIYFTDSQESAPKPVVWRNKLIWFVTYTQQQFVTEAGLRKDGFVGNILLVATDTGKVQQY